MTMTYTLGPGGIALPEADQIAWARWMSTAQRGLAVTEIGDCRISTVFLGIDHSFGGPPLLWETMVFGGDLDGEQVRYSTKEEAERGHNEFVGKITRKALPKIRPTPRRDRQHLTPGPDNAQ